MKHTPGPWNNVTYNNESHPTIIGPNGDECIALIDGNEDNEANARLIAAAPDLYFACRAALLTLEDDDNYYKYKDVVNTLRQAIAKATKGDT